MDFGIPQWCKAGVQTIFIFITTTLLSGARLWYQPYLFSSQQISRSKQHAVSRLITLPTEDFQTSAAKDYTFIMLKYSLWLTMFENDSLGTTVLHLRQAIFTK